LIAKHPRPRSNTAYLFASLALAGCDSLWLCQPDKADPADVPVSSEQLPALLLLDLWTKPKTVMAINNPDLLAAMTRAASSLRFEGGGNRLSVFPGVLAIGLAAPYKLSSRDTAVSSGTLNANHDGMRESLKR